MVVKTWIITYNPPVNSNPEIRMAIKFGSSINMDYIPCEIESEISDHYHNQILIPNQTI